MASGQPHENRPKDRRKLWLWAGVFLLVASAIFWVRVLIAVIAVKGGEIMYHQGGTRAEMWRLKIVPP
ncbi:MAG: hypothetical protein QF744_13870, partial [SAR202 cluster bacterium]|nr:hypothetical protein [SAR202 cluster bacterium]